jgi:hypothetical protein
MGYTSVSKSCLSIDTILSSNELYCHKNDVTIDSYSLLREWMSDCCLMPIQQFFSYIMARTS